MEALRILLLVVVASILYGILHDLVTAHLCVEYFSIGHAKVIESESPIALALVWGVLATWWMGLIAGLLLVLGARQGKAPKRTARELLRPVLICLAIMGAGALVAGIIGRIAAESGTVYLVGSIAERLPKDKHIAYLGNLWAHLASYGLGALLMLGLAIQVRLARRREAAAEQVTATAPTH